MSTHSPKFRNGDVVKAVDGSVGVIVTDSEYLSYSPYPQPKYFVQRLGRGSSYKSNRQWYVESEITPLDGPDMKALSEANIPRPMCTPVDNTAELFEATNSQANFSVGVDEMSTGFSCRLIRPDGAIFMERVFPSRHEAEDHRDQLLRAWAGGLTKEPTRVLKLVEDKDPQKP